jgi:hypothetical protein
MADFRGTILTVKGRNLLAKAQIGTTLTFTKIKLGDGLWPSNADPTQLNDLVSPKLNLPIQEIRLVGDGTVRLRFVLTNTGLSQGFFMREIGIYAQDPDIGEILYAVAYAGDRADFIPADGITKVENVVDIYTVIANAQNVTAVISDTVILATKQDIETVKPEASSTAPTFTYPGKLWIDENEFLKYYNGSSWQGLKVSFADTVDGFHASQTPQANTVPVSDSSGKIADEWLNFVANDPKVKTALNAFGDAPIYACRAWVIFDGTTNPPTIKASSNVSSIIKNGTGEYTVNFIASLPSAHYIVCGSAAGVTGVSYNTYVTFKTGSLYVTVNYCRIETHVVNHYHSGSFFDSPDIRVAFIGG